MIAAQCRSERDAKLGASGQKEEQASESQRAGDLQHDVTARAGTSAHVSDHDQHRHERQILDEQHADDVVSDRGFRLSEIMQHADDDGRAAQTDHEP